MSSPSVGEDPEVPGLQAGCPGQIIRRRRSAAGEIRTMKSLILAQDERWLQA